MFSLRTKLQILIVMWESHSISLALYVIVLSTTHHWCTELDVEFDPYMQTKIFKSIFQKNFELNIIYPFKINIFCNNTVEFRNSIAKICLVIHISQMKQWACSLKIIFMKIIHYSTVLKELMSLQQT